MLIALHLLIHSHKSPDPLSNLIPEAVGLDGVGWMGEGRIRLTFEKKGK